ncbi:Delta(14)-sterol reductase [Coccidioides immitis H538.4]|uniref:Delta(14)-sterol reductase n=1 Tax=Coccidioides immitis H538.4 TaxID=396776 RepID=A0A0J8RP80_COCIT|nr:Delta(14)-sterol reductase [Coccidioides immitis H538.4]
MPTSNFQGLWADQAPRRYFRGSLLGSDTLKCFVQISGISEGSSQTRVGPGISRRPISASCGAFQSSSTMARQKPKYEFGGPFGVKPCNSEMRELRRGGHTGNMIYDFYIGRELNPRITLPFIGEVDLKAWFEMRPGLTGWALLNLAFVAKQYRTYGYVTDSIFIITAVQGYYVLDGQYAETGILGMMDITTDGLGFMLSFGDIVWVPFLYSTQCRYLSVYPVQLGWMGLVAVSTVFAIGLYIFRAANGQKNTFRTNPNHPSVAGMSYIQTKRGTRLLTAGWWGVARHINYFGDWTQSLPFSLPTAFAGYLIFPANSHVADVGVTKMLVEVEKVFDGEEIRISEPFIRISTLCEKYGDDWDKYKKVVKWRIVPGIY